MPDAWSSLLSISVCSNLQYTAVGVFCSGLVDLSCDHFNCFVSEVHGHAVGQDRGHAGLKVGEGGGHDGLVFGQDGGLAGNSCRTSCRI